MKGVFLLLAIGLLYFQVEGVSEPRIRPGKFQKCPGMMCMMHCENGFQTGPAGCEICKCKQAKDTKEPQPDSNDDVCSLPKVTGRCRAAFIRWYYNKAEGKCTRFTYGGCGANKNNFKTETECRKNCDKGKSDVKKPDQCPAGVMKMNCFTDPCQFSKCPNYPDAKCRTNHCGGCTGKFYVQKGKNEIEVTNQCWPASTTAPMTNPVPKECKQPKIVGSCEAAMTRWFYNVEAGECQEFVYGGCDGNDNNFNSKKHCEEKCTPEPMHRSTVGYPQYPPGTQIYPQIYPQTKKQGDKLESVKKLANLAEKHGIMASHGPRNITKDYHPDYPENMKVCLCY